MLSVEPKPSISSPISPPSLLNPCIKASGPPQARVMIVGEAPGEEEERRGLPFVGRSGEELRRLLSEAGFSLDQVYMTNVLWTRPPDNKLEKFLVDTKEFKGYSSASRVDPPLCPPLSVPVRTGKYLHIALHAEVTRLYGEISAVRPNLILALGATALWALTGQTQIGKYRGTLMESLGPTGLGVKVLPTYHPANVLRQWENRPVVLADLLKAHRQSSFPELRKPKRWIWCDPNLDDIRRWNRNELTLGNPEGMSVDVETRNRQITEIGFSCRPDNALVIPFIKGYKDHYWPSVGEESQALDLVRQILYHPVPKIFQNGLYDIQYLWKTWGIPPRNCVEDTMILHHSIFPELQKGLGFLGSVYTDEPAWKVMRTRNKDNEKRDDE